MITYQNTYSIAAGNNTNALGPGSILSVDGHAKTIAGLISIVGASAAATVTFTVNGFVLPVFNLDTAPAGGMPFVLPLFSDGYGDTGVTVSYTVTGETGSFLLRLMI